MKFKFLLRLGKNQKIVGNDNDELEVKSQLKTKQPIKQQPKIKPPDCPSCKRNSWL